MWGVSGPPRGPRGVRGVLLFKNTLRGLGIARKTFVVAVWGQFGRFELLRPPDPQIGGCAEKVILAKMAILGYPELRDAGESWSMRGTIFRVAT